LRQSAQIDLALTVPFELICSGRICRHGAGKTAGGFSILFKTYNAHRRRVDRSSHAVARWQLAIVANFDRL
jgi:hypothetical protein